MTDISPHEPGDNSRTFLGTSGSGSLSLPRMARPLLVFFVFAAACGGGPQSVPPSLPAAPVQASRPAGPDPFALPEGPRDSRSGPPELPLLRLEAWEKSTKVKGVPPPPATCAAPSDKHVTAEKAIAHAAAGPVECADVTADGYLRGHASTGAPDLHVLVGLSLAAKLARTGEGMPTMGDATDKAKVKAFIQGPLAGWLYPQTAAIETLSNGAAGLAGIARGIAAIEAGVAELRLVDKIRSAPTPSTWDQELKAVYEIALDEALEPRKKRGRDAALVGLSDFADAGVLGDARTVRARALLSKLYGGRRIDALDGLLLPAWSAPPPGAIQHEMDPAVKSDARARFELGRLYWRRVDFVEAAYAAKAKDDRLLLALAIALAKGPNGAKEMMTVAPSALSLNHTEALDALAEQGGKEAGMAAYDAAHLRALSVPEGAESAPYLRDVAARFKRAAGLLEDPAQRRLAEERAADYEAAVKVNPDSAKR